MTANELADKCCLMIEDYNFGIKVVTMLRQQAKEIQELKERLELAEWDENAWKKFKQDNYQVINLTPRSEQ